MRPGPTISTRLPSRLDPSMNSRENSHSVPPPHEPVPLRDPAKEREHQPDGELGRRTGEDVGRVRDDHAALGRRLEVDVVDTDRIVGDDLELRPDAVEERSVDGGRQERQDTVGALRRIDELERLGQGGRDLVEHRRGDVNARPGHEAEASTRRGRAGDGPPSTRPCAGSARSRTGTRRCRPTRARGRPRRSPSPSTR